MKLKILFGLLLSVLVIGLITNPSQEQHKEAVKVKVEASLQKIIDKKAQEEGSDLAKLGAAMSGMFSGPIVEQLVATLVSSDNYYVCSLTKINWDGQPQIVGLGVFGKIFLSPKIDQTIEDGAEKYLERH